MHLFRSFLGKRSSARARLAIDELEPRVLLSVNVLTYHNDIGRTGQNLAETVLTPANVNAAGFGKLFTDPVDGAVYAQPLYVSGVAVPGQGTFNLLFVATEHDSVYAFNADVPGPALWHDRFINPGAGVTTVSSADLISGAIGPEVGITGTPVIDPRTNTLYVVAFTKEVSGTTTTYVQRLHALDLATGAEKLGGPVVIQASVPGSGQGSSGAMVSFNAFKQNQRPGLLLEGGVVWIAWASFDDHEPYHGWVIGYSAQTLQQVAVFNTTPQGGLGGIWESGDGPAADAAGNLYVVTGNGTFDASSATPPNQDYGDSFLELTPTAGGVTVASSFTPFNQATLDARDEDLGSGGVVLLPDQPGPNPHLLVGAGKEGKIYLLNRDSLGGFNPSVDNVVQELPQALTTTFSTPAYFNSQVYWGSVGDTLKAFTLAGGLLSASPASQSSTQFGYPGTTPSISANGSADGIVWAVQNGSTAVLRAYDAGNLATELYDSNQAGVRDLPGSGVKFVVPTIASGKVYVGTQAGAAVFGLLADATPALYGKSGAFVAQAYQDLLGRTPDPGGLAYWCGQLDLGQLNRTQFAQDIVSSPEYRGDEVQRIYTHYLHRTAEPLGLSQWTAVLLAGTSLEQVQADIVGSPEYFQTRAGGTNSGFLNALYQDALGRMPDPGGFAGWSQALAGGLSRTQVAADFFAGTEFQGDLVQSFYATFLHRAPEPSGLNGWLSALQQGMTDEQVIAAFVGSAEYFSHF
jgi:hypothetical protein